jgi:hypothetical protein
VTLALSPTQSDAQVALRSFLLSVLPATGSDGRPVSVIEGQDNRVAEPLGADFVTMTTIRRTRLATNEHVYDALGGTTTTTQETEVVVQLDVHGANMRDASDMAQTISTMMRDPYATTFFSALGSSISPLHADDPRQVAFVNAEKQYETRYVVEALLQVDQAVAGLPQQFADVAEITLIDAEIPGLAPFLTNPATGQFLLNPSTGAPLRSR